MSDFKLGDLVKRIADPAHDYRYMKTGEIYTVTGLPTNDCESVQVNGFADYWDIDYFELYKPQQIIVEAEPTELEEAYAHIESLESALGDAVREIFSLKHQLIAKAANTCLGVVQGESESKSQQVKPVQEYTLEDWELAIENNWEFELRSGEVVPVDEFYPSEDVYVVSLNNSTQTITGKVYDWDGEHENDVIKRVK